jgi:hypothetical protein
MGFSNIELQYWGFQIIQADLDRIRLRTVTI